MNKESIDFFNAGIRISLEIGTQLHAELEGVSIPLQCEFVGMDSDSFIIITSPKPYATVKHKLFKGNHIIVRYLYKGTVYAFQTKLIDAITKPARLVFLEYPKIVQHKDLRTHKRMNCYIPTAVLFQDEEIQGALLDINKKGCKCQIQGTLSEKFVSLNINDLVSLKFPFPGVEGKIQVIGKVTNLRKSKQQLELGVLFHKPSLETEKMISQYILSVYDYL